ncbi:glutathione synthetase-like [Trichogramma pretiosum]|uniref:glutathione synthetase-like n=1 Tax=Trichogramma pretiosum TaxID=7493 RepID=UPI0006C98251|nr:glutathione synthetase-like [Trichogramma pretiosum]XP_023314252.1 glutathione synthetase-like [Trichogramma pretiosum]
MDLSLSEPCVDINLPEVDLKAFASKAKDWNFLHGVIMKSKKDFSEDHVQIAPFLLLPSKYPKKEFNKAKQIQTSINALMHKVAHDYEFLQSTLKNTIEVDFFTSKLFDIYEKVHSEGFTQSISLGLLRADYMMHSTDGHKIKQVETNMISSSFAGLSVPITEYQRFALKELGHMDKVANIPNNNSAEGFAMGLVEAWKLYNTKESVIMIVVEDIVYNIYDQRVIEFCVHALNPSIVVIRKTLKDLIETARIGPNKELLVNNMEVAVVYYRTAYQIEAYTSEKEWSVRLLIERSLSIKCPSIHYQLAGTKKVQQQLAVPGILEKFITDPKEVDEIRDVFMGIYSLDLNEQGDKATAMALKNPKKYVLKPQREGGGNNVYNEEIKLQLDSMKTSKERSAWILMERIFPPLQKNYLIKANEEVKMQNFISELGIYGVIMGNENQIFYNTEVGHILRTKPADADEGGIVSGAGALDNPYLVD